MDPQHCSPDKCFKGLSIKQVFLLYLRHVCLVEIRWKLFACVHGQFANSEIHTECRCGEHLTWNPPFCFTVFILPKGFGMAAILPSWSRNRLSHEIIALTNLLPFTTQRRDLSMEKCFLSIFNLLTASFRMYSGPMRNEELRSTSQYYSRYLTPTPKEWFLSLNNGDICKQLKNCIMVVVLNFQSYIEWYRVRLKAQSNLAGQSL